MPNLLLLFILILYVLECLNLIKRMVREEKHTHISSEVCCNPPLSLRVLLSRATAQKSPYTEVLKIRFVLGDPGIYCFNIKILFIPT